MLISSCCGGGISIPHIISSGNSIGSDMLVQGDLVTVRVLPSL
jgi:hypothetical protein